MAQKPYKEIFLSLVTLAFIFFTTFWLIPEKDSSFGPLKKQIIDPIRTFWLFWGLDQNWALFSPTIKEMNYHTVAFVSLKDGTNELWEVPRMDKLDLIERFRQEKFRKWGIDSLPWKDHKSYWPYIARYVGRKVYKKENPPVRFSLLLFWTKIPKPNPTTFVKRNELPKHTSVNHLFTYQYAETDFQ